MDELRVLQAVRLKGRVSLADLAATTLEKVAAVQAAVADLIGLGLLTENKERFRLTPDGRRRLADLLSAERRGADAAVLSNSYAEFRYVNAELKETVSEWQVKGGEPNLHDDIDYDSSVLARLQGIHDRVTPVVAAVAVEVPRLAGYASKLASALSRVGDGEMEWLMRPTIDSYHTVWFELHEELIAVAGLTREDEAAAGHA